MNKLVVEKFKSYFEQLNLENSSVLDEIYATNLVFIDPIHKINGLVNLQAYFNKLNDNLIQGSFEFTDESIVDNKAYLSWEMNLELKKPKKKVSVWNIRVNCRG